MNNRSRLRSVVKIFVFVWLTCIVVSLVSRHASAISREITYLINRYAYQQEIGEVSGTGSMYPTFPKGSTKTPKEQSQEIVATYHALPYPNGLLLFNRRYFSQEIERGDIVTFENQKTRQLSEEIGGTATGFIKRVVALPSDIIEIRGGLFYLNGEPQKEPYTARAQSTFGGDFLPECRSLTIPDGKVFVMGDNRKGSSDSRHELGLVDLADIDHFIPLEDQVGTLDKNWRDTAKDLEASSKITLDKEKYLELLNEERKKVGAGELKYQPKLEQSAQKRGGVMLKFDDYSFEAVKSGYTMEQATADVGYFNTTWGEAATLGHYEYDELLENQLEFPRSKSFLLNKDFQEIGIAEVEGEVNGCPTQVIVQHLAGYIPPNYSKEVVKSWEEALSSLKNVQKSWAKLVDYKDFYKEHKKDVDRINEIISTRISNISAIVKRMEANQWLTTEEKKMAEQDEVLAKEQESLAGKLNSL